jgi:hypothetical protein
LGTFLAIIFGIFIVATAINANNTSTNTSGGSYQVAQTEPQTEVEKVQAAVAAQYSCTPAFRDIRSSVSDDTATLYFAGCSSWVYMVSIAGPKGNRPEGTIAVTRLTKWNGE